MAKNKKETTIGEKIDIFLKRSSDLKLNDNQRKYAQKRVQNLKKRKERYSVILFPDSIIYGSKNKRKRHNYVVLSNEGDNVAVAQVTHSKNVSKKYILENFDGSSKLKPKKYKLTINKKPISYLRGYEPRCYNNKLSKRDKKMVDEKFK